MEAFDPHTLATIALGGGLGTLLALLAERYNLLEQRRPARCPACGVLRRRGACSCSR
jgi:hypothetical protein